MEWDSKVEMVKLGNQNGTPEGMKAFQDYTLGIINEFDDQAWDMFSNLIILDPKQMGVDIDYWTKVYELIKDIDCNNESFGFRSSMRIAMIQTICEDELKLKENE